MVGWQAAQLSGPRFVEVRRMSSKKVVWSSYVPNIDMAIALWEKLECARLSDFEVEIHAQHGSEIDRLADMGYFDRQLAGRC
jgi:hypothetical protein